MIRNASTFESLELFAPPAPVPRPLSVSELNGLILALLEETFPQVWVAGELSGVKYAASGHVYFSLKDEEAVIDAVLWRPPPASYAFAWNMGCRCWCAGRISVYVPRGKVSDRRRRDRAARARRSRPNWRSSS